MKKERGWFWVIVTLLLLVGGQVCNKLAADEFGGFSLKRFIHPIFIITLLVLMIRGFTWLAALKNLPLSAAYPVLSLSFPSIMIISLILFGEQVSVNNIFGSILILLGVTFISREQ